MWSNSLGQGSAGCALPRRTAKLEAGCRCPPCTRAAPLNPTFQGPFANCEYASFLRTRPRYRPFWSDFPVIPHHRSPELLAGGIGAAVRNGAERSKQSVRLAVGAGGEVQFVGIGSGCIAEGHRPKSLDRDGAIVRAAQLAAEVAIGTEAADPAVPEVADQNLGAERSEVQGSPGDSPRRIERAA